MGESRWIVLIDKTPRGPLTEAEVRTLIEQKIVRVNDLASKLEARVEGKKAEWKFLWQFPEFDRRRDRDGTTKAPVEERREKKDEAKLEEKKQQLLPEELEGIHPEDLSYHSTAITPSSQPKHSFENTPFENPTAPTIGQIRQFNWRAFAAIPVMLVAGVLAFKFTGGTSKTQPDVKPRSGMQQPVFDGVRGDPEYERDLNSSTTPLTAAKPPPVPPREVRKEAPSPADPLTHKANPDRGDISYDEYRRRQEEELERERQDEDRVAAEEQDDEEEAPVKKPKKKSAAKKRKAASEEDEEAHDPLEETIDEDAPQD